MANFVQSGVVKTAVRELAAPIATVAAFTEVVDDVITNNPFGCTAYHLGTENHAAVEKTREAYTGRVIYENGEAETVGQVTRPCPTVAAYTANVATVLANAALATAMGGTAAHATDADSFSATVRCHDANGEVYTVSLGRGRGSRSRRTRPTRSSRSSRPGPTPCRHSREDGSPSRDRNRLRRGVPHRRILRRPGFWSGRGVEALRLGPGPV